MTQINNSLVKLENVGVFLNDKWLVKGVTFEINKGQIVTLIGPNGSGKTTTANQLLCLLRPTDGHLLLDGVEVTETEVPAWQDCCSYVPQSITLLNSNIIQNIAYGLDEKIIDHGRVWDALRAAQLADLVSEMPMGLHSSVGDNGIRLSGGQRQRLAIARAFYRPSKLSVLGICSPSSK